MNVQHRTSNVEHRRLYTFGVSIL